MRLKIVGIGKCGIRIAYDFFAHNSGLSSAYEIRLKQKDGKAHRFAQRLGINPVLQKIEQLRIAGQQFIQELKLMNQSKVAESPLYATIDSDSENNEVVKEIRISRQSRGNTSKGEDEPVIFPGRNYDLNNHKGGCDYHIISENLARLWSNVPGDITDGADVSIFVTSFSVGGGTGGGSAPIISDFAKKKSRSTARALCHFMCLGVLPKSDEKYKADELVLNMADYEKFSTGRFMVSLYGQRVRDQMDSLWLFSNDSMRFLVSTSEEKERLAERSGEASLNLSIVNTYIAKSLVILSNCSSTATKADTNPDPRELNNKINQQPFLSGMAQVRIEPGGSQGELLDVKKLLKRALANVSEDKGNLSGLSVPVRQEDLEGIHKILDAPDIDDKTFLEQLDDYDVKLGPIEFSTPERIVIIYGQPDDQYSAYKRDRIELACGRFFSNSQLVPYSFRHPWPWDVLLVLLIDPFIMPVVSAMYYYANNAWGKKGANLRDTFDDIISSNVFDLEKLAPLFQEQEHYPESIYGAGTEDVSRILKYDASLAVSREQMIEALRHLHAIFHRTRPELKTSSALRRKPI